MQIEGQKRGQKCINGLYVLMDSLAVKYHLTLGYFILAPLSFRVFSKFSQIAKSRRC